VLSKSILLVLVSSLALVADDSPAVTRARQDLDKARELVTAGVLAPAKLAEAQAALDDATDEAVLDQTLYGEIQIEDLDELQAANMVGAAERRLDRQQKQIGRAEELVAGGVMARGELAGLESELARRQKALDQAKDRAALLTDIVETANAEALAAEEAIAAVDTIPVPEVRKPEERVDGDHVLQPGDIKALTLAFEKQFDKPLPVSARGSTAVHRALGFDHTGRVDVALSPDSAEGVWLRTYLDDKDIPYYAFRVAIPGKATAPHIHIGPGSTRLRS
jgi:hypothetical protein